MTETINHPKHYNSHPSGVECITITEHFDFCIGNAIKYLWRAGLKNTKIDDLKKAEWYIKRSIERELNLTERINPFRFDSDLTLPPGQYWNEHGQIVCNGEGK